MTVNSNDEIKTGTGIGGSQYTKAITNDELTNEDFLKLMIQELKLQDPTKPTDSKQMLASQMQMSTISTNQELAKSMESLKASLSNMTLTNAVTFMGKKVDAIVDKPVILEDGSVKRDKNGDVVTEKVKSSYKIATVQLDNGVTKFESHELVGFKDVAIDYKTNKVVKYDFKTGQIKDEEGNLTEYYIKLTEDGRFETNASGDIQLVDKDGKTISPTYKVEDEDILRYEFINTEEIYSSNQTNIQYEEIVKVY
ncbi:flagellar hook assembly protein FlgD [Arcobacter sp. YIC-310]|uniref:flagellar hook assembly protein FlgD n=1 Tax=Arcobacter sp. YIC-310 TaxID=3376632 RepID=UPI003C2A6C21